MSAVPFDFNHRRTFLLDHFLHDLTVGTVLHLKSAIESLHIWYLIDLPLGMKTIDKSLEDTKAHLSEGGGGLVAVYPTVEIRLGEGFDSKLVIQIKQVGSFHSISDGEGNDFKNSSAGGIFPG